jgi:hypothetical protein
MYARTGAGPPAIDAFSQNATPRSERNEGVKSAAAVDADLEAVSAARVLDRDGKRVIARVPEQQDMHAVAFPGSQFPTGCRCSGGLVSFNGGF